MPSGLYYEHSGKFTVGGLLVGLLGGMAISFPLAFIYAYITLYNPFIYINFIGTALLGVFVGGITGALMTWRKVRNGTLAVVVGILVGAVAYYFAWAIWLYAFLRRNQVEDIPLWAMVILPPLVWEVILKVNEVGAWTLRSFKPTGVVLWGFWGAESLTVLGASIYGAFGMMIREPFCENCGVWCHGSENLVRVAGSEKEEMKRRLEGKGFGYVEKLGPVAPDALAWFQLDLHHRPTCSMTHTLTVKTVTVKLEGGKRSEDIKGLVDKLLLTSGDVETIRRLGQKSLS